MQKITVEIQDEYLEEFLKELVKFREEECENDERCLTIFGLSIEDYKKHCSTKPQ